MSGEMEPMDVNYWKAHEGDRIEAEFYGDLIHLFLFYTSSLVQDSVQTILEACGV
jgi:hypothetical protein